MFKEFEKYKTGDKIKRTGRIVNMNPPKDIEYMDDEYEIGLGNLIYDFIKHLNKPFWRKKFNHKLVTEQYVALLNSIITWKNVLPGLKESKLKKEE